jgi:multiple sugar transport system permease protein
MDATQVQKPVTPESEPVKKATLAPDDLPRRSPKFHLKRKNKEAIMGIAFASPWFIGFFGFTIFPLLTSLYYSFTDYNRVDAPNWVGWTNYSYLFTQDTFIWKTLGNTLFQVVFGTAFSIIMGIVMAVILNKPIKGIGIWRTIFYLPNVVSAVAMGLLWTWIFNKDYGLVNDVLGVFGIHGVDWLGDENLVKISLILMSGWGAGITALFFLGAMKSIPHSLYEAAEIAGVSPWHQFWSITMPLITPTIFFMLVTSIIGNFQYFTMAYIMVGRGTNYSAYYLAYYLYDKAFTDYQLGYASAISWFMLVIVIALVLVIFKTSKKWVHYMGGE